jgi:mitochondrial transcription factor 1
LIDFQPRTPHWSLRLTSTSSRRGESSYQISATVDIILKNLLSSALAPLDRLLEALWPGASEYIMTHCDTLKDPKCGGLDPALSNQSWALNPRMLNAAQLEDILERWFEWPFRPEFSELVGRVLEDDHDQDGGVGKQGTAAGARGLTKID